MNPSMPISTVQQAVRARVCAGCRARTPGDAGSEAKRVPEPAPVLGERLEPATHCHGHPDGPHRCIGTRKRIVEEDHHAVSCEPLDRSLEAVGEIAERGVVFAEDCDQVLGLDCLGERREAAQVAEDDGDLTPMTLEERLVT